MVSILLAIHLAYQNPRRARATNLVFAVLIYLTYSNLQNLMQNLIQQGKVPFAVGLFLLHVIVGVIAALLLWQRIRNPPFFSLRAMFKR